MNIAKILKKCPSGTKLYSPLYGEIELVSVYDKKYPIVCSHKVNNVEYYRTFTEEGKCRDYNAELMLYPSRDQRDWNKFGVTDQVNDHQFKPFDRVLVRDRNDGEWGCDFFSHIAEDNRYICIHSWWKQCIPYEGNEHLLNTTNKPE
jgi:uncharacterized Fe-S cluster protein YjdI